MSISHGPIPEAPAPVPAVTTEEMIEVDRLMVEDYGVLLIQMMENAGRTLAQLARARFLGGDPRGARVAVFAGPGGNGGGALVAARRLACWGADVSVALGAPAAELAEVPAHQLAILRRMGLRVFEPPQSPEALSALNPLALLIDGLIGYSLKGAPTGPSADLIGWLNAHPAPKLALDAPSGVDAATGVAFEPCVRAHATLTLALPKTGLLTEQARPYLGELYCGDLSVPPTLYGEPSLGRAVGPVFAEADIVRIF